MKSISLIKSSFLEELKSELLWIEQPRTMLQCFLHEYRSFFPWSLAKDWFQDWLFNECFNGLGYICDFFSCVLFGEFREAHDVFKDVVSQLGYYKREIFVTCWDLSVGFYSSILQNVVEAFNLVFSESLAVQKCKHDQLSHRDLFVLVFEPKLIRKEHLSNFGISFMQFIPSLSWEVLWKHL